MVICHRASRHLHFALRTLMVLSLLCALMGCAASSTLTRVPEAPSPVVHVTFSESSEGFAEAAKLVIPDQLKEMNVSFDPKQNNGIDLRLNLQMTYRNVTEAEFETIWRTTTLILLTLYPSTCGHRAYQLTATLSDAQGHSRTYEDNDTSVAWLWLLHGDKCGDTPPPEEIESQTEQMLDAVFEKMRKDNVFAVNGLVAPQKEEPLVNIEINRAEEIADQVLSVDRTFARWTRSNEDTRIPDYRVDLRFDVWPGGFSILKGYMGIMTLGLTSPCRASHITLTATVTGPGAVMARSYTYDATLSGRMGAGSDCEVQNESNRPEVFAKLLRKAFRQIVEDKLIGMAPPPSREALPPLVHISTSRADGIVRQETVRIAPFARYYFHDSADYVPDYDLSLKFKFTGGGRKELSVAGSMGAGVALAYGINLFCNPTTMLLDAALSDHSGIEVRHFQIERTFGFSGELRAACHDDELSNPGAVGELVRELYQELAADRTLANITIPPKPVPDIDESP